MRIFDTRWEGAHGIGRFARELYLRLPGFSPITLRGMPARALEPIFLERYLREMRASFFLSPGYNAPLTRKIPFAFCLHDLNHLADDEPRAYRKRKYYEWFVRPALSRAEIIFTVSEYSRNQICDWANIPSESVVNVGNGISEIFNIQGNGFSFGRYFVHVGGARPHKNLQRIMEALASSKALRNVHLVCVGGPEGDIMRLAANSRLSERTLPLQNVSDERLAEIYRGASGLLFASLREGFGLPIVEAMACGCPVITSRISSMPEVSGDAALLVDPRDTDDIAKAMERIICDEGMRKQLVARGRIRASEFSWELTAQRVNVELSRRNL